MKTRAFSTAEAPPRQIVPTGPHGLAVRSAALVRRGLRDLARQSNWIVKKVFEGQVANAAVSPDGQVCALSSQAHSGAQRVTLFDVERSVPAMTLTAPGEFTHCSVNLPSRFAWSPDARYLVGACGAWPKAIQAFDLHGKQFLGAFADFADAPADIAWSPDGRSLAVSSLTLAPELQVWRLSPGKAGRDAAPFDPALNLSAPDWMERQGTEADSNEAGTFSGYGKLAFSPSADLLAAVVEIKGEWADDSLALLDAHSLDRRALFSAQGHVTALAWSHDSSRLIYCSGGQAYAIDPASSEPASLPFGAEMCAWHPHMPVCLFFSSWLKNSAKGRLFLADMNRVHVFDEHPAEGVLDLRWSADGAKAYAVTADGLVYVYEPELL